MTRPLEGVRVVVTRARRQAGELTTELQKLGAQVLLAPTIEIGDPHSWHGIDEALWKLGEGAYEWVLFASVNAVRKVAGRAGAFEALHLAKIAAVGPATAAALRELGLPPHLVPDSADASALATALGPGPGALLWPRVADAPKDPVRGLESLGWTVDEVVAYTNVPANEPTENLDRVREGRFDIITFTSPSTVRNFVAGVAPFRVGIDPLSDGARRVVCIGPSTARQARDSGLRVDKVAGEQSVQGLVKAVCELKVRA